MKRMSVKDRVRMAELAKAATEAGSTPSPKAGAPAKVSLTS